MAEATKNEKGRFGQWWKGLKAEFKKISWPDKESVGKQTAAVIVITILLGLIISLLDNGLEYLVNLIYTIGQ